MQMSSRLIKRSGWGGETLRSPNDFFRARWEPVRNLKMSFVVVTRGNNWK